MAGNTGPNLNFIESIMFTTALKKSHAPLSLINQRQKSTVSVPYLSATRRCLDIHEGSCEMIDGLENLRKNQDHFEMP